MSESRISSSSSSDESHEGEDCKDPVMSPPAKTSSSSTSTSKTSSPLGSLTLLSLPNKPKLSSRPWQQHKKRTTPPLIRTSPISSNSSDSFASNQVLFHFFKKLFLNCSQETNMESFVSVDTEEKHKKYAV